MVSVATIGNALAVHEMSEVFYLLNWVAVWLVRFVHGLWFMIVFLKYEKKLKASDMNEACCYADDGIVSSNR